jgi:hypothetical protein
MAALAMELTKLPFKNLDADGALMAYYQCEAIQWGYLRPIELRAIREIEAIRNAKALSIMVNILPAQVRVKWHVDPYTDQRCVERWHLAVTTNCLALYAERTKAGTEAVTHMMQGYWSGNVPYWQPHRVWNDGRADRLHFIVDLDLDVPGAKYDA